MSGFFVLICLMFRRVIAQPPRQQKKDGSPKREEVKGKHNLYPLPTWTRALFLALWIALPAPFQSSLAEDYLPRSYYDLSIPASDTATALNRLAEQADINLIFPYLEASNHQANPVIGRYSLEDALEKLLEGTGLSGSFSPDGTIKISRAIQQQSIEKESSMNKQLTTATTVSKPTMFAALMGALFSSGTVQSATQNDASSEINEIIVSAQKREQSLLEVPISETVLGAEAIQNARIDTGAQIARQTPNLRVSLLGNESQPKFSLRGVSTATFNLNAISPVGVFYDEVYVGASYQGGAQLFDIERIEVLRGPQGTLFGKNTTGGAINFISKKPSFEQEGYLTLGAGSNSYTNFDGALEVPLIDDRLSARLAFTGAHSDGYIENQNPAGRDLSSIDRQAFRLSLGYQDDNGLNATLRLFQNEENPDAIGAIVYGTFPGGVNSLGINPRINPLTQQPLANDETFTDRSGILEVRGKGANLTVEKDFGPVALTSITSYLKGSFLNQADADGSFAPLLHIDFGAEDEEYSQDLRLTSNNDGPFNWILGLYYYTNDIDVNTAYRILEGVQVAPGLSGGILNQSYSQNRESYAAYGDFTYDLTDVYTFYGGIRFTDDEGTMEQFQVTSTSPFVLGPGIPLQPDVTYNDSEPTGRIGLRAQLNEDLMLYGQFVYGYRSSDINGGALTSASDLTIADPETLKSYEVGLKSRWLDNRIMFTASAFYYDFTDQQFIDVVSITDQKLVNAGSSKITGLEIETLFQITDNFRLSLGLGLLDSEYDELVLSGQDLSGNELIEAPEYTFNFAADYRVPLANAGTLDFHVDGTAVDSQYFSATNDDSFLVDSFFEMGAQIAYKSPSEQFAVRLYGKNLTDNDEPGGLQQDPGNGISFTTVPYPRRYGIEISYNF